jgi:hypothetical protein
MPTNTKANLAIFAALAAGIGAVACSGEPISKHTTPNGWTVQLLFEEDGCRAHSAYSGVRTIYWVRCANNTQTQWHIHSGKTRRDYAVSTTED